VTLASEVWKCGRPNHVEPIAFGVLTVTARGRVSKRAGVKNPLLTST